MQQLLWTETSEILSQNLSSFKLPKTQVLVTPFHCLVAISSELKHSHLERNSRLRKYTKLQTSASSKHLEIHKASSQGYTSGNNCREDSPAWASCKSCREPQGCCFHAVIHARVGFSVVSLSLSCPYLSIHSPVRNLPPKLMGPQAGCGWYGFFRLALASTQCWWR